MFNDGNGSNGRNGSHRRWQTWGNRDQKRDVDLSSYRRLAAQLHHGLPHEAKVSRSVLLVTPDEPSHWANGCVTLASCMAEELRRPVLLAEACDSEICSALKSSAGAGLADFLHDPNQPLEELAMRTSQPNLWFLSAGNTEQRPLDRSMANAKDFLVQAAEHWDFVILGGGPVLRNSSALAMARHVGRVLLLVTENRTHLEDIDVANNALQQCGAKSVSLVLTELDEAIR